MALIPVACWVWMSNKQTSAGGTNQRRSWLGETRTGTRSRGGKAKFRGKNIGAGFLPEVKRNIVEEGLDS